jgi:hypothetical protein
MELYQRLTDAGFRVTVPPVKKFSGSAEVNVDLQGYSLCCILANEDQLETFGKIIIPDDFPRSWLIGTETQCLSQYGLFVITLSIEDTLAWTVHSIHVISSNAASIGNTQPEPTHRGSQDSHDRPELLPVAGLDYPVNGTFDIKLRPTLLYPRLIHNY